ncbi:MAG: DUF6705 family protein [Flavobacteriaceae bacterium]
MKNLLYIVILLNSFCGVSQVLVLPDPVESEWENSALAENKYYKDINGVLDKFVGTWKYEDTATNTVFEITFEKDIHVPILGNNSFSDELKGQFKLTIGGVEQYNTYTNPCSECIIVSGFRKERIYNSSVNYIEYLPISTRKYFMLIAEPSFEDDVDASSLKLYYNNTDDTLIWTNTVMEVFTYDTDVRTNNYQMPLNMVLIRQ